jgi:hypothetical protein
VKVKLLLSGNSCVNALKISIFTYTLTIRYIFQSAKQMHPVDHEFIHRVLLIYFS